MPELFTRLVPFSFRPPTKLMSRLVGEIDITPSVGVINVWQTEINVWQTEINVWFG